MEILDVIAANDLAKFKLFIEDGLDINSLGGMLLRTACALKKNDIVKYLINKGADVNIQNGNILSICILVQNHELIDIFLNAGANPNLDDAKSVLFAVEKKDLITVIKLIRAGADVEYAISLAQILQQEKIYEWLKIYQEKKYLKDKLEDDMHDKDIASRNKI